MPEPQEMKVSRCFHEWETDEFAASPEAAQLYARAHALCTAESPDYAAAFDVLNKAVKAGSPRAAYALASWYLPPGRVVKANFGEAMRLLREAARFDIPEAHYDLAVMHAKGAGVKKSKRKAFEWRLRAAIRGDAAAAYRVGVAYFYGDGVRRSRRTARIWLDRAEELGLDPETGEPRKQASPLSI